MFTEFLLLLASGYVCLDVKDAALLILVQGMGTVPLRDSEPTVLWITVKPELGRILSVPLFRLIFSGDVGTGL